MKITLSISPAQHFGLLDAVAQTLAGRTTINQLLPLSLEETRAFPDAPTTLAEVLWAGGYPRIHDRRLPPTEWLGSYVATYVERDVRHVLRVADLMTFQTFVRLCAGRAGQLLNLSALGADAGVSQPTARQWLNVLERLQTVLTEATDARPTDTVVAYGGTATQQRSRGTILAWQDIGTWAQSLAATP